jgi:hypothetical protein
MAGIEKAKISNRRGVKARQRGGQQKAENNGNENGVSEASRNGKA